MIQIRQGEYLLISREILDENTGEPADLTGASAYFAIQNGTTIETAVCTIVGNVVSIAVPGTDAMDVGEYPWEIRMWLNNKPKSIDYDILQVDAALITEIPT